MRTDCECNVPFAGTVSHVLTHSSISGVVAIDLNASGESLLTLETELDMRLLCAMAVLHQANRRRRSVVRWGEWEVGLAEEKRDVCELLHAQRGPPFESWSAAALSNSRVQGSPAPRRP